QQRNSRGHSGRLHVGVTVTPRKTYPEMLAAMRRCIRIPTEGLRTALLTNNCYLDEGRTRTLLPLERSLFDVVVESCVLELPPSQAVAELSRILDIPLNNQPSCTDTNPIMSNWDSELVMDAKTAASKLACSG
ncbi:hypothetical protein RRG08_060735, partial [Elysia crispata]